MEQLTLKGFEKYEAGRKTLKDAPQFKIGKGGRMIINRFAYKKFFEDYSFVEVFYNKETKMMALKYSAEETVESYKIRLGKSNVAQINCMGFFKYHKIDVSTRRLTKIVKVDEEEGVIYLEIGRKEGKDRGV